MSEKDPMYYILTAQDKKGAKWNENEFFNTGVHAAKRHYDIFKTYLNSTKRFLDIGCGIGRIAVPMLEYFDEVHGVDISPEMILKAKSLHKEKKRVSFHEVDGSNLNPFKDSYFDCVYSIICFQHIPENEVLFSYFSEVARVLKNDGIFYFQLPTHIPFSYRFRIKLSKLLNASGLIKIIPFQHTLYYHVQIFPRSIDIIEAELKKVKFEVIEITGKSTLNTFFICRKKQ